MHLDGPSADVDSQRLSVHFTLARLRMTFFYMRAARTETSRSGVLTRVEFPASVCTIPMKHLKVVLIVVACVTSFACAFAQAEKIKGKAKDLKKNIEAGQTNNGAKTNAPAKK